MMAKLCILLAIISIVIHSDGFKQVSFRHTSTVKTTALSDFSVLHDTGVLSSTVDALHHVVSGVHTDFHSLQSTFNLADADVAAAPAGEVSLYSKVDKTGFIGGCASYVEQGIDLSHNLLMKAGLQNTYGFSIILFTILIKAVTLPLTTAQLESTTKMQKLTPLQKRIQERFADDEPTKNKYLSQLFQAAAVNPLAGCFPALIQIPIFISLYRALQNLIAENKLAEPFLWVPDLEGPVYQLPPGESLNWVKSIFSGTPDLGWEHTLAYLTLPVILYASQSYSSKVMAAPKDPLKVLTEQEQISQSLVNNLPFVIAFFSLNVPAGLAVYWIINNILTTGINLVVKNQFKDDVMPAEVAMMMAEVDAPVKAKKARVGPTTIDSEFKKTKVEDKSVGGFSSTLQAIEDEGEKVVEEKVEEDDDDDDVEKVDTSAADDEKKRKRRAASRANTSKKGKKKA
mmetsp:Transcript_4182/g.4334  ORF Transcript_4182/g.4334 Transcript_4182/m.4334 type:complete len:456 (+) Transcript_4182:68-1435(+)